MGRSDDRPIFFYISLLLLVMTLKICLAFGDLVIELRLQLLLGKTFGLELILLLFKVISDLIVEQLDIVI